MGSREEPRPLEADELLPHGLRARRASRRVGGAAVVRRLLGIASAHKVAIAFGLVVLALIAGAYRVESSIVANCEAIEALKASEREDARESYRNRYRTAAILGIEVTPEVERVARRNLDADLRRFRSQRC